MYPAAGGTPEARGAMQEPQCSRHLHPASTSLPQLTSSPVAMRRSRSFGETGLWPNGNCPLPTTYRFKEATPVAPGAALEPPASLPEPSRRDSQSPTKVPREEFSL